MFRFVKPSQLRYSPARKKINTSSIHTPVKKSGEIEIDARPSLLSGLKQKGPLKWGVRFAPNMFLSRIVLQQASPKEVTLPAVHYICPLRAAHLTFINPK